MNLLPLIQSSNLKPKSFLQISIQGKVPVKSVKMQWGKLKGFFFFLRRIQEKLQIHITPCVFYTKWFNNHT